MFGIGNWVFVHLALPNNAMICIEMPIATFTESAIYNLTPERIWADLFGNIIKIYLRQTWLSTAIEPAGQRAPL